MTVDDIHRGNRGAHFGPTHPLTGVAARHCQAHLGSGRRSGLGRVTCGACWERAIRDDERAVVLFGLPGDGSPDPAYVDEIAVERACRGERVRLSPVERAEAVRRLDSGGVLPNAIGRRLGMSYDAVRATLAGLAEAIPLVPTAGSTVLAPAAVEAVAS